MIVRHRVKEAKHAVVTLNIGMTDLASLAFDGLRRYAVETCRCAFHVISRPVINGPSAHWEKLQMRDLLRTRYTRILYLDLDILIKRNTPNLFELFPDEDFFYAYDEIPTHDENKRDIRGHLAEWARVELGLNIATKFYINSGVMLLSRWHACAFDADRMVNDIPWRLFEQTWINASFHKWGMPLRDIGRKYNAVGTPWYDWVKHQGQILHYAGKCGEDRLKAMRFDRQLFGASLW